jgi:hypothetical protein
MFRTPCRFRFAPGHTSFRIGIQLPVWYLQTNNVRPMKLSFDQRLYQTICRQNLKICWTKLFKPPGNVQSITLSCTLLGRTRTGPVMAASRSAEIVGELYLDYKCQWQFFALWKWQKLLISTNFVPYDIMLSVNNLVRLRMTLIWYKPACKLEMKFVVKKIALHKCVQKSLKSILHLLNVKQMSWRLLDPRMERFNNYWASRMA